MIDRFSAIHTPSWDVEKWVRRHSTLTGYDFLVALTVASFHNPRYGYAFPSISLLEKTARVSNSTVKRAIQSMKDSDEWIVVSGRGGPEGSHYSSQYRANRYYPTMKLAGLVSSDDSQTNMDELLVYEQELNDALAVTPVRSSQDRFNLREVWLGLPEKYRESFLNQITSGHYEKQLDKILRLSIEIKDAGLSISDVIAQSLSKSSSEPEIIISWLSTWGLLTGKTQINKKAPTDFLLHEQYQNINYGESGQDF